jgi:hypothetical protein
LKFNLKFIRCFLEGTSINFLITGKLKGPLPNSSQKGEGCTKVPIRCRFVETEKIKVFSLSSVNKTEDLLKTFESKTTDDVSSYIDSLSIINIEELIIEIPLKILPKTNSFLKNVQFLDLIGMPDINLENAIDLNRKSINRQQIDAVCIAGNANRGMCNVDMIRYISLIDIFSNIRDTRPTKLFILCIDINHPINHDNNQESIEKENQRLKCKKSIQKSIIQAFDYNYKNENLNEITVDEGKLSMKLPIDHKKLDLDEVSLFFLFLIKLGINFN